MSWIYTDKAKIKIRVISVIRVLKLLFFDCDSSASCINCKERGNRMTDKPAVSQVEQLVLAQSGQKLLYAPTEKVGVIVVDNFPALGKLAALRFIEWVQQN